MAAERGHGAIVELLVKHGAKVGTFCSRVTAVSCIARAIAGERG